MTRLVMWLGLSLSLIATNVAAQYGEDTKRDRRFYVSPMATYTLFDDDRALDDEIGYQLSFGKILGRGANVELQGSFTETSFMAGDPAEEIDAELTSLGLSVLLFQWRNDFPLYGILSVSKGFAEADGAAEDIESDQFDVGLGYLLSLGNWPWVGNGPALRVEARYRLDKYSQSEANAYAAQFGTDPDRSQHDGVFGIGLFLPLGADPNREREEPELKADRTIYVAAIDSDGDRIPDDMDQCPNTPDGAEIDVNGCERDSDKDGVANSKDQCKGTPTGQPVNAVGCPRDDDADGVRNPVDRCPNTPPGVPVLADGCGIRGDCRPPEPGQRVDSNGCAVGAVILRGVNFETGSATLTATAKGILDDVATALDAPLSIKVEVGGHTDSVGSTSANQKLSELRALSVKRYLVSRGVKPSLLLIAGYGESQPLVSNDSAAGRQANRRVELKIIE